MDGPALASPDFAVPAFAIAVRLAVEAGLDAAAILDANGKPLAVAGALADDEARALAALVTGRLGTTSVLDRMLHGELMTSSLDDREVSVGVAASCVFFVVVHARDPAATSLVAVDDLRADIEQMVGDARALLRGSRYGSLPPPPTGSGGSSSGPAELPVTELGVTVRRRNSN